MSLVEDWRYVNLQRLRGETFNLDVYEPQSEEWDHDHCTGCWAKFAGYDGPEILHRGYVAKIPHVERPEPEFIKERRQEGMRCIPQPAVQGFNLRWVCSTCFEDFRELLGFKLESL